MTGLASKWATDETLVNAAKEQDKAVPHHKESPSNVPKPLESKWSKPITVKKSEGLVSKWATAEDPEEDKVKSQTFESPKKAYPKGPRGYKGHQYNDSRDDQSHRKESNYERQENVDDRHNYNKHTRHQRNNRDQHRKISEDEHKEEDDEETIPMSDAAKAFAARLGPVSGATSSKKSSGKSLPKIDNKHNNKRKEEEHEDEWEDASEEDDGSEEEEEKVPMSAAAKAFAARLNISAPKPLDNTEESDDGFVTTDEEDEPPKASKKSASSLKSKKSTITKSTKSTKVSPPSHNTTKSGQSKPNRIEWLRQKREKEEHDKKLLSEKAKKDQDDIIAFFQSQESKSIDWASLED
ncbi:uncharacterized protein RJT21DRAFT_237 [Scheffersomyces amazonensis]|uniref:uncharacterized protein n=1 Tax=Scheffersomyces amazonensis TaxID=1078765 RepID=UPI00315D1CEA